MTSGQVGCITGDPCTFDVAMEDAASRLSASMMEDRKSFEGHNRIDWVDVPTDTSSSFSHLNFFTVESVAMMARIVGSKHGI